MLRKTVVIGNILMGKNNNDYYTLLTKYILWADLIKVVLWWYSVQCGNGADDTIFHRTIFIVKQGNQRNGLCKQQKINK